MSLFHKKDKKNKKEEKDVIISENDLKDMFAFDPHAEEETETSEKITEEASDENEEEEEKPKEENPFKKASADAFKRGELSKEQLDALDILDRDLSKARQNKEVAQKEEREAYEAELKKEKEFYENAKNKPKRSELSEMTAKPSGGGRVLPADKTPIVYKSDKKAKQEKKEEPLIAGSSDFKPYKPIRNPFYGVDILKALTVFVVILGVLYAGLLIYMRTMNNKFIEDMEKDLMGISSGNAADDKITVKGDLSAEKKKELELSMYLPDSDKDGLSDSYELDISHTDPKNPDTDSDKITDAAEIYLGLDPLSENDSEAIMDIEVSSGGASVKISGKPMNAAATVDPVTNSSILGASGILGEAYEFYTAYPMQSCTITIDYDKSKVSQWNVLPSGLSIYRFNDKSAEFEKLDSTVDEEAGTVSAQIENIGIYAVGVSEYVEKEYKNKIFFLIDNSGSMYPEKLCPNSEENDVNFKRLDFANSVIDKLGDSADYGAAMFTGTYTKLSSVTSDAESVKTQIDSIRKAELYFDGTRICDALSGAVDELGNSVSEKNYIILLTDGYPTDSVPSEEEAALKKAVDANITVFTVGLGKRVDSEYLNGISTATNGMYYQVSNAEALDRICDKIKSFMNYNLTTVTMGRKTDVYITADSGFNADKDSLPYQNFRTDFSESGMDFGIAELTRQYFTGELKTSASNYYTDVGTKITGYDITSSEQLSDGKQNLVDIKISFLDSYGKYLEMKDKWDYKTSETGLLQYNESTKTVIEKNYMKTVILPYTVKPPELEDWMKMLQNITFQIIPDFSSYECAVLRSDLDDGENKDLMDVFRYMQFLHESSEKCVSYDFGYDGEKAFDVLRSELTNGDPAVISVGGTAYNAVRLLRESENTNKYILEAYDCNSPAKTKLIKLFRTPVYDGGKAPYYQYSAVLNDEAVSLIVYKTV